MKLFVHGEALPLPSSRLIGRIDHLSRNLEFDARLANGSLTSKYVQTALIMAADTIAGYTEGLPDEQEFKRTAYAHDCAC